MTAIVWLMILAVLTFLTFESQSLPQLEHLGNALPNNSYIYYANISDGGGALKCVSSSGSDVGNWRDERGRQVQQGADGASCLYVTRGDGVVSLNHKNSDCIPDTSGLWRCDVPDSSGENQSLYIYISNESSQGILDSNSASVYFTLNTDYRQDPPFYSITCRTHGGPATIVTWVENHVILHAGKDENVSQIIVDKSQNCTYESVLHVRGRRNDSSEYGCAIRNNIRGYLPLTPPTLVERHIIIRVAEKPTSLTAVIFESNSTHVNITVSWESPGDPVTGYVIYYKSKGGPVISDMESAEETETHSLDGLQRGVTYYISIVALSDHLPSPLVGPVAVTSARNSKIQSPSPFDAPTIISPSRSGSISPSAFFISQSKDIARTASYTSDKIMYSCGNVHTSKAANTIYKFNIFTNGIMCRATTSIRTPNTRMKKTVISTLSNDTTPTTIPIKPSVGTGCCSRISISKSTSIFTSSSKDTPFTVQNGEVTSTVTFGVSTAISSHTTVARITSENTITITRNGTTHSMTISSEVTTAITPSSNEPSVSPVHSTETTLTSTPGSKNPATLTPSSDSKSNPSSERTSTNAMDSATITPNSNVTPTKKGEIHLATNLPTVISQSVTAIEITSATTLTRITISNDTTVTITPEIKSTTAKNVDTVMHESATINESATTTRVINITASNDSVTFLIDSLATENHTTLETAATTLLTSSLTFPGNEITTPKNMVDYRTEIAAGVVSAVLLTTTFIILILYLKRRDRKKSAKQKTKSPMQELVVLGGREDSSAWFDGEGNDVSRVRRNIPVTEFPEYVLHMIQEDEYDSNYLAREFLQIPSTPFSAYAVACLPHNISLNRFRNIYPYDNSRVRLKTIPEVTGSDYINASFINGYQGGCYIAAQAPLNETIDHFWRMVWECDVEAIVMLTKCVEMCREKSAQYWPELQNETIILEGRLSVTLLSSTPYTEYHIRKLLIKHLTESDRPVTVTQFHYTAWPDHGVPENVMSVIRFIRHVRKLFPASQDQPLLVHCSAGVGRTGTFITLDMMMQQIKTEATLSVCQCVRNLRTQRMKMVQSEVQYEFIHYALSELVVCGETEMTASSLRSFSDSLRDPEDGTTHLRQQLQTLDNLFARYKWNFKGAKTPENVKKNRFSNKLPNEIYRVRLMCESRSGSDYINASFVNGYQQRDAYIVTQGPLKSTVEDFWRMMWEYQCGCIVMLCQLEEDGQESSYCYWPGEEGGEMVSGRLRVRLVKVRGHGDIVERKLAISVPNFTEILIVKMIQLTSWPLQGFPHPSAITSLIDKLTNALMASSSKQTVVMCSDGVGRSGTFLCIHSQLEHLKTEGMVDVFQVIKSARIQRPGVIPNIDHYVFCFEVLADYVEKMEAYHNFKTVI